MTQKSIDEQIEVLRAAGERACASPESAANFLKSAGIPYMPKKTKTVSIPSKLKK